MTSKNELKIEYQTQQDRHGTGKSYNLQEDITPLNGKYHCFQRATIITWYVRDMIVFTCDCM